MTIKASKAILVKPTLAGYGTILESNQPGASTVYVGEDYPYTTEVGSEIPYDTYKRDGRPYYIAAVISTEGT
jgi:hypothetical protein